MNIYETIIHKIYTGNTRIDSDVKKRTVANFIEAMHNRAPEEDKGLHFYASLATAKANYTFNLGQQKTICDEQEMELRKGMPTVVNVLEETFNYCKSKIDKINFKPSKSPSISPEQAFKNFDLIKEVMREHDFINPQDVSLLNKKQSWKISALIVVITFYKDKILTSTLSETTMIDIFNSFLKTTFSSKGKKDTKEFKDLTEGIKNTFRNILPK